MTDNKTDTAKIERAHAREQVKEDARAKALRENLQKRKAFVKSQKSENNDDAKS